MLLFNGVIKKFIIKDKERKKKYKIKREKKEFCKFSHYMVQETLRRLTKSDDDFTRCMVPQMYEQRFLSYMNNNCGDDFYRGVQRLMLDSSEFYLGSLNFVICCYKYMRINIEIKREDGIDYIEVSL